MKETVSLLSENVKRIGLELSSNTIRQDWKTTRVNYSRIDEELCIDYNDTVVSAYSIGTTPVHTFLLRRLFSSLMLLYVYFFIRNPFLTSRSLHVVCFCGGSGAELLALMLSLQDHHFESVHITVVDKEPRWSST